MEESALCNPILVLDDDSFVLRTLAHLLRKLGQTSVVAVDDAERALGLAARTVDPFALVLCDLNMPGMDGIEFLRHLGRQQFRGGIILISGEDLRTLKLAEDVARGHDLDVVGSVTKPVRGDALAAILTHWRQRPLVPRARAAQVVTPHELRRAIDGGELIAFFQPQVRMSDGCVMGVEALARWVHPERGLLLPDSFIGVAENHGLIDALTFQVIGYALARLVGWRSAGLELNLAINVSTHSLKILDFTDRVMAMLGAAGVAPSSLVLEMTESRFMEDAVASRDTLARLRLKRVGLSIDDFGTGFASLSQLRDLPFDELKIDRSFVQGAGNDPTALAILESNVALGKRLGISLVAEGVESPEDWARVQALGCDIAQGYLIARPMAAAAVEEWVGRRGTGHRRSTAAASPNQLVNVALIRE